jgi:biotin carboxylase
MLLASPDASFQPPAGSTGVWFSQAHSCQRDLVLAVKHSALLQHVHVVASHGSLRPEITANADIALQEPAKEQRLEWLLENAQKLNVKLVIAGHFGQTYLAAKQRFADAGIRLMAGCSNAESLIQLHDKAVFTDICQQHGIAVVPATKVSNADEMQAAYDDWASHGKVCVKPVQGVFAAGFWRLDPNGSPFESFANSQNFKAHPQIFIDSYRQLENPPEYLVMPFLPGLECSVDMFCDNGTLVQAVARYKHAGDYQTLHLHDPAIELARKVAQMFQCDGLVNMQARYAEDGQLYILEVNPRPSGGIGNTLHSGLNMIETAVAHGLGLAIQQQPSSDANITVRGVTQYLRVDH